MTNKIRYNYPSGELASLCEAAIRRAEERIQAILQVEAPSRTIQNSLLAFEEAMADFHDEVSPLTFMAYVSPDESLSKEAAVCEEKASRFGISVWTRKDLYLALKSQKASDSNQNRLLFETLQGFEENGLKLPDSDLNQVREWMQTLAALQVQFSTHLNRDETSLELEISELQGVPKDYVDGLKKSQAGSGEKVIVPTHEPDYVRVMENATFSQTRKKMLEAYENRAAPANTSLLEQAIQLRQKIAQRMGFSNWADHRTQNRMATNSQTVLEFLTELKGQLAQRHQADLGLLLKVKQEFEPNATRVEPWDVRFLANQYKKKHLDLDDEKIREYFPADGVVKGMFEIYSTLFGVKFIKDQSSQHWFQDVQLFEIQDAVTQDRIGYFYADFYPRSGKYGHAAAFTLKGGRETSGGYSHPISAIVANFPAPKENKPSLLNHEEVRTLFHEFGHIMHQTLTRAPYASLSGSNVDQDFVEAPSQMLENWVFSEEILNKISGHYQDPNKKLPRDWVKKLIAARDFNQGYFYTRQLFLALLDMNYHTHSGPVDTTAMYKKLYQEILTLTPSPKTQFQAGFGHLMGGYDAGYYGYLWSEVYSADLFSRFEKEGILNSQVGLEYRRKVLEPGKMKVGFEILESFLGRKPNASAFYRKLKIHEEKSDYSKK